MNNDLMNYVNNQASGMGISGNFLNKLNTSNNILNQGYNQDREAINTQMNQAVNDYERERQKQDQAFTKEGQSAYVDYAKSINPYSTQQSSANRIGLSGNYSESSLIGANNTYQNRYTSTKNNYDNIFADINNNITKARETGNIQLAQKTKEYQDRMLENLWRVNDEQVEERRYQQELAAARAKAASKKKNNNEEDLGGSKPQQDPLNSYEKLLGRTVVIRGNWAGDQSTANQREQLKSRIYTSVNAGQINREQAEDLLGRIDY